MRTPVEPPAGGVLECCVHGSVFHLDYVVQRDDAGFLMCVVLPRLNLDAIVTMCVVSDLPTPLRDSSVGNSTSKSFPGDFRVFFYFLTLFIFMTFIHVALLVLLY